MKKLLYILLPLLLLSGVLEAQKKKAPKNLKSYPQDTTATRQWVRDEIRRLGYTLTVNPPVIISPVVPDCKTGLDLVTAKYDSDQIEFSFQAVDVQAIDWTLTRSGVVVGNGNTGKLTSSRVFIKQILIPGNYELQIKATNCNSDPIKGKKNVCGGGYCSQS